MTRTAAGLLPQLRRELAGTLDASVKLRHAIHADPELAGSEHRTVERIAAALAPLPTERVGGTGLLVRVGPGEGPCVAVRAELDGLPIREQTGVQFSATGLAMHACGHDVHCAALVAALRAASHVTLPIGLLGVFQPSEEAYPSGARTLVELGVLQRHRVQAMIGVHVHPEVPVGAVAAGGGPVNAAADNLRLTLTGNGGHGAYPHTASDPILALSAVVVTLQHLVSRRVDPTHAVALTIATLQAGEVANVIPGRAEATGTLRTLNPADRPRLRRLVEETVKHVAAAHGCDGQVVFEEGEPLLRNDPELARAVRALLPDVGLVASKPLRSCGSDDFSYYGAIAPLLMLFLGVGDRAQPGTPPLHHPSFLPGDSTVGEAATLILTAYSAASAAGHQQP